MFSMQVMDVNTVIKRALIMIRAESIYQDENQDARQYILDALNDILYLINVGDDYLPYYHVFRFNMTTSVNEYIIGTSPDATIILPQPMASIDYVNIIISGYRYPIIVQDNFGALYNTRPLTVTGRPTYVWIRQDLDNFHLQFYPRPNQDYQVDLLYKDTTAPVVDGGLIGMAPQYRAFLIYWLAKRANSEGGYGTWSPENEQEFQKMQVTLKSQVSVDNRVRSMPPYLPYPSWYSYNLGVVN